MTVKLEPPDGVAPDDIIVTTERLAVPETSLNLHGEEFATKKADL